MSSPSLLLIDADSTYDNNNHLKYNASNENCSAAKPMQRQAKCNEQRSKDSEQKEKNK